MKMAQEVDFVVAAMAVVAVFLRFGLAFEDVVPAAHILCFLNGGGPGGGTLNPFLDMICNIFLRVRRLKPAVVKE
jgi:hypothetical protein